MANPFAALEGMSEDEESSSYEESSSARGRNEHVGKGNKTEEIVAMFPGLDAHLVRDIVHAAPSPEEAVTLLAEMGGHLPAETSSGQSATDDASIDFIRAMFDEVSEEVIHRALVEANGSVDEAISLIMTRKADPNSYPSGSGSSSSRRQPVQERVVQRPPVQDDGWHDVGGSVNKKAAKKQQKQQKREMREQRLGRGGGGRSNQSNVSQHHRVATGGHHVRRRVAIGSADFPVNDGKSLSRGWWQTEDYWIQNFFKSSACKGKSETDDKPTMRSAEEDVGTGREEEAFADAMEIMTRLFTTTGESELRELLRRNRGSIDDAIAEIVQLNMTAGSSGSSRSGSASGSSGVGKFRESAVVSSEFGPSDELNDILMVSILADCSDDQRRKAEEIIEALGGVNSFQELWESQDFDVDKAYTSYIAEKKAEKLDPERGESLKRLRNMFPELPVEILHNVLDHQRGNEIESIQLLLEFCDGVGGASDDAAAAGGEADESSGQDESDEQVGVLMSCFPNCDRSSVFEIYRSCGKDFDAAMEMLTSATNARPPSGPRPVDLAATPAPAPSFGLLVAKERSSKLSREFPNLERQVIEQVVAEAGGEEDARMLLQDMSEHAKSADKLETLSRLFPHVSTDVLHSILSEVGSVHEAEKLIRQNNDRESNAYLRSLRSGTGRSQASKATSGMGSDWSRVVRTKTRGMAPRGKAKGAELLVVESSIVGRGMSAKEGNELYARSRRREMQARAVARQLSLRTREAYARGDHAIARSLAGQLAGARAMVKECAAQAAQEIFSARNSHVDQNITIDLHGLQSSEATTVMEERLNLWGQQQASGEAPRILRVITGVGKHSAGAAVLRPTIWRLLDDFAGASQPFPFTFSEFRPGVFQLVKSHT